MKTIYTKELRLGRRQLNSSLRGWIGFFDCGPECERFLHSVCGNGTSRFPLGLTKMEVIKKKG